MSPSEHPANDSWARLKHNREWLCGLSCGFDTEAERSKALGVHTLIDNALSFVSGDVGSSPGFKEPEEGMSSSPQACIIAMEQQQLRAEVLLYIFSRSCFVIQ